VTIFGRNDATKQGIAAISRAVYENLHGQSITPGTFPSNQFVPIAPIAIRDQPGGNVIGQLTPEDPVTVVLSKRRWVEIKLSNNGGGWVTYSSLKLTKEYTWE
jgi:hypothetical protein